MDLGASVATTPPPATGPGAAGPPAIEVRGMHKSFGETRALRGVDFTAFSGEIHAIVGENGSGKSTMAKIISGIFGPDSGTARIFGEEIGNPIEASRAGVATVFQEVLVAETATVAENVFMGMRSEKGTRRSRSWKRERAGELMSDLVGHEIDPDEIVEDLPLAVRQWVTIARAIAREPRVVVFDESTAALDLDGAARLYAEMQRLRDGGACVLVVTHRIAELTSFADRATVLRDGKTVGVVEGAEITLDRLLEMMSGVAPSEDAVRAPAARAVERSAPVLTASAVQVQPAFAPSDLELYPGEIIGFAGLDGQGQSEFIQALTGVAPFASGSVQVHGDTEEPRSIHTLEDAIGARALYISGDRRREGIFTNLSIFENFAMPIYKDEQDFGIIRRRSIMNKFREQSERLSLRAGASTNLITSLSGGNQQKVIIGRVLAQNPRVVALNDPARGVDIRTKRELYQQLDTLAASGAGVVYLSTEIDELVGLCHRVAVFRDGALFTWLEGEQITSDRILGAMFGHLETDFQIEEIMESTHAAEN